MAQLLKERHIGRIKSMTSSMFVVSLDDNLFTMERTVNGKVYRIGQIGSFIVMPIGDVEVVGIVNRVYQASELNREIEAQVIGSVAGGKFQKGVAVFPTLGCDVYMTDEESVATIFASFAQYGFAVGDISGFPGERQYIDPNKFFGKHIAVLGSSGSGKSTTVASILQKVHMFENTHV
ncbi:MAG: DUF87 domain-containing protein, partial [Bacteroidota bacterium]